MSYKKVKARQIEEALASMPSIDLEAARQAMARGGDGKDLGLPDGWQWLVAMRDAHSKIQEVDSQIVGLELRKLRLESSLLTFKGLFEQGFKFPASQRSSKKGRRGNTIGRPPVEIDINRVESLLSAKPLSLRKVAKLIGVHHNTLIHRKNIDPEFKAMLERAQNGDQTP